MKEAIVIRCETANMLQKYKEITIEREAEGFLLMKDGSWKTVLPGQALKTPENARGLLSLHRGAECGHVAGVGGFAVDDKNVGGWGEFSCRLLSGRRFVQKHKDALLGGTSAEEVLTCEVRCAMRAAFAHVLAQTHTAHRGLQPLLAMHCLNRVSQQLFESGWQLTDFRLKHVHI